MILSDEGDLGRTVDWEGSDSGFQCRNHRGTALVTYTATRQQGAGGKGFYAKLISLRVEAQTGPVWDNSNRS